MSWRKHETHREETKAVKAAFDEAGITAEVKNGRGTAWSWLEINVGDGRQFGEHLKDEAGGAYCPVACPRCEGQTQLARNTLRIAKEVTGRSGDYDGEIQILTQNGWCQKCRTSYAIQQGHKH